MVRCIRTNNGYIGILSFSNRKPLPLTTVEMQKAGSRLLHLSPKQILDVILAVVPSVFLANSFRFRLLKVFISVAS